MNEFWKSREGKPLTAKQKKALFKKIEKYLHDLQTKHKPADDLYLLPDGTIYQYCLKHKKYETSGYLGGTNDKEDAKNV